MGYNQKNIQLTLPITIGTTPLNDSTLGMIIPQGRQVILPSAPPMPTGPLIPEYREPLAPQLLDDDTVSIRTYASTPPPFPDDGKFQL